MGRTAWWRAIAAIISDTSPQSAAVSASPDGPAGAPVLSPARETPNINFNVQVAPLPTTNFTPYLRAFGDISLLVATGHPPGSGAILAQAGQLGIKAPVVGAYNPYSLVVRNAGTASYGRWSDFKCMATATKAYKSLAKRYLRAFPQNEFLEDDALALPELQHADPFQRRLPVDSPGDGHGPFR